MKTSKKIISVSLFWIIMISAFAQIDHTILNPEVTVTIPDSIGTNYYNLDLNDDGNDDYKIGARSEFTIEFSHKHFDFFYVFVESIDQNKFNAGPFWDGDTISSSLHFVKTNWIYGYGPEYGGYIGSWPSSVASVETYAFIGLEFNHNNETHFGWVRLKTDGKSFTVESFAWNESANQPINAGQTN